MRQQLSEYVSSAIYHTGLWSLYFGTRPRGSGDVAVVVFHRLVGDGVPYIQTSPTVQTHVSVFEAMVAFLARRYLVLGMDDLVARLESGTACTRDAVVVTFDDGYEDNLRLGLPVLERYQVPATFFLSTDFVGAERVAQRLWNDRLEQAILRSPLACCRPAEAGLSAVPSEVLSLESHTDRTEALLELGGRLKDMGRAERDGAMARLEATLEVDPAEYRRTMLTWDEARRLADRGHAIGSHGVSHTIMTRLGLAEARAEIAESKRVIEERLGLEVRHFAYPNGREEDFSPDLVAACREAGYRSVSTCAWGLNRPGRESPYWIRRLGLVGGLPRTLVALERCYRREWAA